MLTQPTQVTRPWRATVRTVFQFVVALSTLLPLIAAGIYTDAEQAPAIVGQVLAVAVIVTRIMGIKEVEQFLTRFFPWLAADPDPADAAYRGDRGAFQLLSSISPVGTAPAHGRSRDRDLPGKARIRARRQRD